MADETDTAVESQAAPEPQETAPPETQQEEEAQQDTIFIYGQEYKTSLDTSIEALNLQYDFGINPHSGVYDEGTKAAVRDYVYGILDNDAALYLDKGPDGTPNRITTNLDIEGNIEPRTFEIAKGIEKGAPVYFAYELDKDGERSEKGVELDVGGIMHPALVVLMDRVNEAKKQALLENTQDADFERLEEIRKEREIHIKSFLEQLGAPELEDQLGAAVSGSDFNAARFQTTELYRRLEKNAASTAVMDDFLMTMTLLAADQDRAYASKHDRKQDQLKADGVFKMFHLMATGESHTPQVHENELAKTKLQDNIFAHGVYDMLERMPGQSSVRLSQLIDERYEKQTNELKAYFGEDTNALVSREEILQYARDRFDVYAIETLSYPEKQLKDGATKDEIRKFIDENEAVLKNVTAAMHGDYKSEALGKTVWFNPYEKDFDLVHRSMGTPDLNDPKFLKQIQNERQYGSFTPTVAYAMRTSTKQQLEALYEEGKHLLKDDPESIRAAVERNAARLGLDKKGVDKATANLIKAVSGDEPPKLFNLAPKDAEVLMGAIVGEVRPELFNAPNYSRIVANYYEMVAPDMMAFRSDPFVDRYGPQNQDELTKHYFRTHGRDFEELYGRDVKDLFFINGQRNYDLQFDDIMDKISAIDPAKARQFEQAVKGQENATSWQYFRVLRVNEYRENRADFDRQEREKQMIKRAEAAAKPEATAEADDETKPGEDGSDIETVPAKDAPHDEGTQNGHNLSVREQKPGNLVPGEFGKGGLIHDAKAARDLTRHFREKAAAKAAPAPDAPTPADAPETPQKASDKFRRPGYEPEMRKGAAATDDVKPSRKGARADDSVKPMRKGAGVPVRPEIEKSIAAAADDIPLKKPALLKRIFSGFSDGLRLTGRGVAAGTKWAGVGIAAGSALALAEIAKASENNGFLEATGMIDKDVLRGMAKINGAYLAQSAGDISAVGGEFAIKELMMGKLVNEHDIDPVTANMIMPDLLIDLAENDELSERELTRMREVFNEKNLERMYANIAEKYGLPTTIAVNVDGVEQQKSIGVYLRSPAFARDYLDSIQTGTRERQEWRTNYPITITEPTYDGDKKTGYDYILKLNEMAGMAVWMEERHKEALEKKAGKQHESRSRSWKDGGKLTATFDNAPGESTASAQTNPSRPDTPSQQFAQANAPQNPQDQDLAASEVPSQPTRESVTPPAFTPPARKT